jgi:hypothetical protein
MRNALLTMTLTLALLWGCRTLRREPPAQEAVPASGVAPLREAEFDDFASRITDGLTVGLREGGYRLPAVIAFPHVEPGSVEPGPITRAFAQRLAEGLSDRLTGAAVFSRSGVTASQLGSALAFVDSEEEPGQRVVVFRVVDEKSGKELLTRTCPYQPRRVVAAPPEQLPEGDLDIDAPTREIGELALQHAPRYRARTIAGKLGRVIFVDSKGWTRFWLQSQQAVRTADDLLQVELEIRSRRKERDAELRVIFYDDQFNPVDVTPVIPYAFLPNYTKRVVITSTTPRAAHYICLLKYD